MTEELALNQFRRYCRAVDFHEGTACTVALFMYLVRHQLLPCTVGAGDKHTGFGGSNPVNHLLDLHYCRRVAHNLVLFADLFLQYLGLGDQRASLKRIANGYEQAVEIQGLFKEVKGSFLNRVNCRIYVSMA